ncbi:pre-tRNA nuclear export protein, partial [Coemansia spiralis]
MIALAGIPGASGPVSEDSVAGAGGANINPGLADFLIKVLGSLDEEMVNRVVPRAADEAARNTEIKDAMRVTDVSRMAHAWYAILGSLSGTHPDLSRGVLRLMGVYVAWIDINLIVNQPFMRILFELLRTPVLRCAACRCLSEVVGKGMRATDKLQLLQFIGIVGTMKHLEIGDIEFGEQVGRLANVTGIELNAILGDKESATAETRSAAVAMLEELQPLLLTFLSHAQSEVSSSVFAAINDNLAALKRAQREGAPLSGPQQEFLAKLLPILVDKLQYRSDYAWPAPTDAVAGDNDGSLDEDDDEAMFGELRHSLRVFIDAIGQIAPGLYDSVVLATAQGIFK